eukprot:6271318-Pyramimonas_sp.AAC.1
MEADFRAHSDGVVKYINGSFRRVDEVPEITMRRCQSALHIAQFIFLDIGNMALRRDAAAVFDAIKANANMYHNAAP